MADEARVLKECCLKSCETHYITNNEDRVEVKSIRPEPSRKEPKFEAKWSPEGEAVFHRACWTQLVSLKLGEPERTMVKEAAKTAEFFDSADTIDKEAARIAKILRSATYPIAFTGAGISTAAGIGDFRGKSGKWTERDRVKEHGAKATTTTKALDRNALRPTYTHEAMCKLVEMGLLKFVISQNTDGLHRLSGIPRDKIAELHGNGFHEKCELCQARYERPFNVRGKNSKVPPLKCKSCRINHRTGRKCERKDCSGYLMNTIINFGDSLESDVLDTAEKHAEKSDAVLCMGTTLRVTPACDLVTMGKDPPCLIICNRQETPFDAVASAPRGSRVFGDCDTLMRGVMSRLLPRDALDEWQDDAEQRRRRYDAQRQRRT